MFHDTLVTFAERRVINIDYFILWLLFIAILQIGGKDLRMGTGEIEILVDYFSKGFSPELMCQSLGINNEKTDF